MLIPNKFNLQQKVTAPRGKQGVVKAIVVAELGLLYRVQYSSEPDGHEHVHFEFELEERK